ncbi:MAG TPA: hypothetical protein VGA60_02110 [Kiloniellales bacterium]|jgi:hypothetical protein
MRPYWLFAAPVVAVTGFFQPAPAAALGPCEQRKNLVAALAERYLEVPVALGVTNSGSLVEVLKGKTSETWTIIVTSPQGISCLVFSGDGWRAHAQSAPEPGA